ARDHVVRQDSAVAPAADAEAVGIGHAGLYDEIQRALEIFDLVVPPVGPDGARIFLPAPSAAAIVHVEHRVAVSREELPLSAEAVRVLSVRAAMYAQQQGNLGARNVPDGFREQPVHFGHAVSALEAHVLGDA